MTLKGKTARYLMGHRMALLLVLCLFGLCVYSLTPSRKKKSERIYLVHSDELRFNQYGPNPGAQIVKGKVHFRHNGAQLWCDSAYFYQEENSVKAFGHVRFREGDTLSLNCRYAEYDGQAQQMAARYDVVLTHRRRVLHTDSLNYDRLYNYAYFFQGGTLRDGKDRLVADWGEYHMDTRQAAFFYNVKMKSPDRLITTDTLYYDTQKSRAHVLGPGSTITSKDGVIKTMDAYYNTKTEKADLYGRSKLENKTRSIVGDSLFYSKNGDSFGYGNVIYIDRQNKNSLLCDELKYNEKTGTGYATKHALLKDFSQGADTLYAHADSIKLFTYNINTDSVYRVVHCFNKVRAFRTDVQAVCDSLVYSTLDSCMTMYKDPIVWNQGRQLLGEQIKVYTNDSTIRLAKVIGQALSVELMRDSVHYNQLTSRLMNAYFVSGKIRTTEAIGNVKTIYYPVDDNDSSLIGMNYMETDTLRMFLSPERQLQRIWASKNEGTLYPMTQIPTGQDKLPNFAWFEEIRPIDKDDVFRWRSKGEGNELKVIRRHEAPLQHF